MHPWLYDLIRNRLISSFVTDSSYQVCVNNFQGIFLWKGRSTFPRMTIKMINPLPCQINQLTGGRTTQGAWFRLRSTGGRFIIPERIEWSHLASLIIPTNIRYLIYTRWLYQTGHPNTKTALNEENSAPPHPNPAYNKGKIPPKLYLKKKKKKKKNWIFSPGKSNKISNQTWTLPQTPPPQS